MNIDEESDDCSAVSYEQRRSLQEEDGDHSHPHYCWYNQSNGSDFSCTNVGDAVAAALTDGKRQTTDQMLL